MRQKVLKLLSYYDIIMLQKERGTKNEKHERNQRNVFRRN